MSNEQLWRVKYPAWFILAALTSPLVAPCQLYQPEITAGLLAGRTIDHLEVGVIDGSAAVTATGGASYSIPIYVAPGTNGVQPRLSINYNSQGGDGVLGWGWDLGGLSAITRTGTDWYHEGGAPTVRGITFTSTDRFVMDGQRLVMLS